MSLNLKLQKKCDCHYRGVTIFIGVLINKNLLWKQRANRIFVIGK